jgi:hypothetical protein
MMLQVQQAAQSEALWVALRQMAQLAALEELSAAA